MMPLSGLARPTRVGLMALLWGLVGVLPLMAGPEVRARPSPVLQCGNPPEYPSQGQQHAKMHINQLKGAWGWDRVGAANKDENGYPLRLTGKPSRSRVLRSHPGMNGIAPYTGDFRLYGQGTGRLRIRNGGPKAMTYDTRRLPRQSVGGRDYWFVDFAYHPVKDANRVTLEIAELPVPGDHLRAMALVHHTHLGNWDRGEIFMPEVVADLSLFGHGQAPRRGALRYMQSLQANSVWLPGEGTTPLTQTDAQRDRRFVGPDYYSLVKIQNNGAPRTEKMIPTAMAIEDIVALANATGTDLWYNLSVDILDERAVSIGTYVRDHLDPELKVYWEYGNELWNGARGFAGYRYARAMGRAKFPGLGETNAVYQWDVYRGMQLFSQLRDLFDETPERSRYMASFWAFAASNRPNGKILKKSYAAQYFAAERARLEPDIGALPEDIITDMSVGGYFGNAPGAVSRFLEEMLPDYPSRAGAFTQMVEMGMDGDLVQVGPKALESPLRDVPADAPLAVYALLRTDERKGELNLLTGLPDVLRIEGRELQYRGLRSETWTPVVIFDSPPAQTDILQRVIEGKLTGLGRKFYGRIFNGFNSQLSNALSYRVKRHAAFAKSRGLAFHFYEGGPGTDGAPGAEPQSRASFMNEYHMNGWVAGVMVEFIDRIGEDIAQMCWYKTHNRAYGGTDDFWGLKEYYGQDPAETPKWQAVADTIAVSQP